MFSTFKTKPGFRPQVGPLVGKYNAHIHSRLTRARCHLCIGKLTATIIIYVSSRGWQTLKTLHTGEYAVTNVVRPNPDPFPAHYAI